MATSKRTPTSRWVNFRNVVGPSKALPVSDLPTWRDILQQVLLLKEGSVIQEKTFIFEEVSKMVVDVWSRANVRLVMAETRIDDHSIKTRIQRAWENVPCLREKSKKKKTRGSILLAEQMDKLFNILYCDCSFLTCDSVNCATEDCDQTHIHCTCPREKKVRVYPPRKK